MRKRLWVLASVATLIALLDAYVLYEAYKSVILHTRIMGFADFFVLSLAMYMTLKVASIDLENAVRDMHHITIGDEFSSSKDAIQWINGFGSKDIYVTDTAEFDFVRVLGAGLTNSGESILGYITILAEKR
jgi:hypothetical protein